MVRVVRAKKTWRVEGDEDCPHCRGEVCDECRRFYPVGVRVECDDGSIVIFNFRSQTFSQYWIEVEEDGWRMSEEGWEWTNGEPTGGVKQIASGLSYQEFIAGNKAFAFEVIWAMRETVPEIHSYFG